MLPMSKAAILVTLVLSMAWHWNDYFEPNIYINNVIHQVIPSRLPDLYNLLNTEESMELVEEVGGYVFNNAMMMAATFLVIVVILVVYIFLQKGFMEGIEHSGLTGM